MTVTYGFYDSLNGDRKYNAKQMSQMFKGIIADGVFQNIGNGFNVSAPGGMNVAVGAGRAWFNDSWTDNDAPIMLSILASEPVLPRIDSVVIEVNSDISVRANTIKVIKGTPASTPTAPVLANTATLHQHALATIYVAPGVTNISTGVITNIVGSVYTPFVTGAVPAYDFGPLLTGWQSTFSTWFNNLVNQLSGSQVTNLQNQIDVLTSDVNHFNNYLIVPTISAGSLILTIKTLNGTDPTASDPIRVKIGGIVRTLTSSLSLTIGVGFNYFNSAGLELFGQQVQYFVYLGWRASTNSMFIGMARVPYGRFLSHFDANYYDPRYLAYSGTAGVGGDLVTLIGRFNATFIGSAWSLPNSDPIHRPIYQSDWQPYVGQVTASFGSFGTNGVTGANSFYKINMGDTEYRTHIGITDQGTSSGSPLISTVFPVQALVNWGLGRENALTGKILYLLSDTNSIGVSAMDGSPTSVTGYNLDGHIITRISGAP